MRRDAGRWDAGRGDAGRGDADPAGDEQPAPDHTSVLRMLQQDPSLRYNDAGRAVLRWLGTVPTDPAERANVVDVLPPHCLDLIMRLARQEAQTWRDFADQVAHRKIRFTQTNSA